MGSLEAIGLGILQGLTEFLPVSSSGHLSIFEYFLGLEDTPRFFDVMLHVGTLLAVLVFYRLRPLQILRQTTQPGYLSLKRIAIIIGFVALATLPAVAAATTFKPTKLAPGQSLNDVDRSITQKIGDLREYSAKQPRYVLSFMMVTSLVLLTASRARGGSIDAHSMTWWHALGIGLAQMLSALFPGLSRSGMTVSTALLLGLRGDWAVHFSLLMSCAAITGATVLKAKDVDPTWITANWGPTLWGTLASTIVGWFCITLLLKSVERGRWWWFTIYIWGFVAVAGALLVLQANPSAVTS